MSHIPFIPILITDICYGTTDTGKPLLLDIMRPEPLPEHPMPIVVQIHGGGWCTGSKDGEHNRIFAEQGFFTISINYRLSGEGKQYRYQERRLCFVLHSSSCQNAELPQTPAN